MSISEKIREKKTSLGIEFGSTRIKAVLIDDEFDPIASGSYSWENKLEEGYWTYSLDEIHKGLKGCYAELKKNVFEKYGEKLTGFGALGISGMMHGYMAFDKNNKLLVPFRTWRNTTTEKAADELSELFGFNIPQRWTVAHLYQAILDSEPHLKQLDSVMTLAEYINFLLTGTKIAGVGEASGMFPVTDCEFDKEMVATFENQINKKGYDFKIKDIFPKIRKAGESEALLTKDGAMFLDESGDLEGGIPVCAPEGDAGTGMVATNSVKVGTGNVSAGTSVFAMLVLDKTLENYYKEIDMVTTPDGLPVAMVHCNNCCSELDAWIELFADFCRLAGIKKDRSELYQMLYRNSLNAKSDCDGITAYNFISSEPVVQAENGRPMYFRDADTKLDTASFFRAQLYSSIASLKIGMDILFEKENVKAELFSAHGGLFKVEGVAQQYLADGLDVPVAVMKTAGEGGAWGMAVLASYLLDNKSSLPDFLQNKVFGNMQSSVLSPNSDGVNGFNAFIRRYKAGLEAEKAVGDI